MSWKIAGCSILLFVLQHIVRVIYSFGYHLHYYQHYPGPCQQVEGIDLGSASLYTLPDGLTLITSGFSMNLLSPSYQAFYEEKGARGGVYMMDLKNASGELAPVPLSVVAEHSGFNPQSFRPHGISVWHDHDSGRYIVFVVNHPVREVDRVEKFVLDRGNGTLLHVKTYTSPKLRSLYDVQAVGEDSFYVSNVLYEQRSRFFMLLELFSLMPWSSVVLYQPETGYSQVVSGLTSATGLLVSPCGLFVYVLSCMGAEIRVYRRQEDNSLLLQQSYPLFTHPDMAVMDPSTGDLFVGAHPVFYQYLKHLEHPAKYTASSQVLHLRLTEGNITAVTELLYDDGQLVSGSSTAVVFDRRLLVGSTVDHLVLCEVNVPI